MSASTSIQWTDRSWNPVRGCSLVSPGCTNCYAMKMAHRFSGPSKPYAGLTRLTGHGPVWTGRVRFGDEEHLTEPLRWRRASRIFVNSMSDLFHDGLTNEQIAAVFGVMAACPQHQFQVLTKRAERMRRWFEWIDSEATTLSPPRSVHCGIEAANRSADVDYLGLPDAWPLPNVWLGVSVEDQQRADERIPHLLATPAAVRFVSAEPLLGPVDLRRYMWPVHARWPGRYASPAAAIADGAEVTYHRQALVSAHARFLDWVIVGGESGPGARPFDLAWARSIVEQCRAAGVAVFCKQLGADPIDGLAGCSVQLRDRKGGEPDEWPAELRVREFPQVRPQGDSEFEVVG